MSLFNRATTCGLQPDSCKKASKRGGQFLLERVTADPMDRVPVTDHHSFDEDVDRGVLETFFRTSMINWWYFLDGVSIYPVTTKIQGCFLTQLSERIETTQRFHHKDNGDLNSYRA